MATREEIYTAIRNADKAGDAESVRKLGAYLQTMDAAPAAVPAKPESSTIDGIKQGVGNAVAGAVRGAGSIGATILAPYDIAKDAINGKGLSLESNRQRRADMDSGLQMMGAEPDSLLYKTGKLGGEIAGTAGAGGAVANILGRSGAVAAAAPNLVNAIRTSGMAAGSTPGVMNALTRAAGGAISGGVSAGLVNPEDVGTGTLVGGLLPGAAQVAGKVGSAAGNALRGGGASSEAANLAQRAKQLGIDIPADRLVDSKPLNRIAAALNYVPFSGRSAVEGRMSDQLNTALTKTFGQNSSNVTQAVRQAETTLGGQFDNFLKGNTVTVDAQFKQSVTDILNKAEQELGPETLKPIQNKVAEIFTKGANGQIDGQAAYNIKKDLDRIGKGAGNEAFHARELRDSLLDALNRSVGPQEAQAFATLRQQYGNMREIQKLAKNGTEGDISIARLAGLKNIRTPELQELADIAAQFVKGRESSHGAAQLASFGLGSAAGLSGLPVLAGTVAAGRATNAALNSNAMRSFVLQQPGQANALSRLVTPEVAQFGYRAAPSALSAR